jgi:hypothetical protein
MVKTNVHIGKKIKQKLHQDERSVAWLAKKLNCDNSNLHKRLNDNNLNINLLCRISEILCEDFFTCYSEMWNGKNYHEI